MVNSKNCSSFRLENPKIINSDRAVWFFPSMMLPGSLWWIGQREAQIKIIIGTVAKICKTGKVLWIKIITICTRFQPWEAASLHKPYSYISLNRAFLLAQMVKNLPAMQETPVQSLGREDSPGEGNGNPLQYSCPENSLDRGSWQVTVHGVPKSWTPLSD